MASRKALDRSIRGEVMAEARRPMKISRAPAVLKPPWPQWKGVRIWLMSVEKELKRAT